MFILINGIIGLQEKISRDYFSLLLKKSLNLETLHDLLVKVLASSISSNIFNFDTASLEYDRKTFIKKIQASYVLFSTKPGILSWQQQIIPNSKGSYNCNLHYTTFSLRDGFQHETFDTPKILTVEFISEDGEIKIARINRIESMNR